MEFVKRWPRVNPIRALADLLRPPPSTVDFPRFTRTDWLELLRIANACWLSSALSWRFKVHGIDDAVPSDIREYAEGAAELGRQRTAVQLRELAAVIRLLNGAGIRPVVLKGSAAHLTRLYPDAGARLCADIDLLIEESELAAASAILVTEGYTADPEVPGTAFRHMPRLMHPDRLFGIEIHRNLQDGPFVGTLSLADVFGQAIQVAVDGAEMSVLRPDHQVVNCIQHLMNDYREGAQISLRQLMELRQLAEHYRAELNWPAVAAAFVKAGRRHDFECCLVLAQCFVGLPEPALKLTRRGRLWGWVESRSLIQLRWLAVVNASIRGLHFRISRRTSAKLAHLLINESLPARQKWRVILRSVHFIFHNARRLS